MAKYIVNPSGDTVQVDDVLGDRLLADGWEKASKAQIDAWWAEQGIKVPAKPAAKKATVKATED